MITSCFQVVLRCLGCVNVFLGWGWGGGGGNRGRRQTKGMQFGLVWQICRSTSQRRLRYSSLKLHLRCLPEFWMPLYFVDKPFYMSAAKPSTYGYLTRSVFLLFVFQWLLLCFIPKSSLHNFDDTVVSLWLDQLWNDRQIVLRVLRVDRQILKVDRRLLRMNRQVLRVDKRVLRVQRAVKQVLWVTRRIWQVLPVTRRFLQ